MISESQFNEVMGATAYDSDGNKIGKVGQLYLDDETGAPSWATVQTGLFGTSETFVPLQAANFDGAERLDVPFSKDMIKDAPRVDADGHIGPDEQDELYRYYQLGSAGGVGGTGGVSGTVEAGTRTGSRDDTALREGTVRRDQGTGDDAMTRSEEQLRVGTERVETGRVRLRKYVTTEQQQVTVPVTREEVRVEREPITDANRDAAMSGSDITEDEHEIVLSEERPVIEKETVPVERVRLEKEQSTAQETVSGEVRKEQIDVDGNDT